MNGDDDWTELLTRNLNSRRSGGADFRGITVGEMATAAQAAAAAGAAAARSAEKNPGSNGRGSANSSTTRKVRNTHNAAAAAAAACAGGSSGSSKSSKVKKDHSNAENRGARPKDKSLNNSNSSSRKNILGTSSSLNREHATAAASIPDPRGKTEVWLHPSDLPLEYRAAEQDLVVKHKKKPVGK